MPGEARVEQTISGLCVLLVGLYPPLNGGVGSNPAVARNGCRRAASDMKIADLAGVREHAEGDTVELWLNENGRIVVRKPSTRATTIARTWTCRTCFAGCARGPRTMSQDGSPLYPLLNEINKAATSGMPFLAVAMTVALPDICVSLASAERAQ